MSSRCLLFASNQMPDGLTTLQPTALVPMGLWYDEIPLLCKILCSAETRICPSVLFHSYQDQAIVADLSLGLLEMTRFLRKIRHPNFQYEIEQTLALLHPFAQYRYVILETSELFVEGPKTSVWQTMQLCQQLRQIAGEMTLTLQQLQMPSAVFPKMRPSRSQPTLLARLLGASFQRNDMDPELVFNRLGFAGFALAAQPAVSMFPHENVAQ